MDTSTAQFKHCDMVKVNGRVDSSTAPILSEALGKITDAGRYKIAIDFAGVQFLSSAGLRVLIATQKICKRYNRGEVVLAAVPANIQSVFELAGLTAIFKIFPDVPTAVGEF
jgi:anti-sigma B factor antagonist